MKIRTILASVSAFAVIALNSTPVQAAASSLYITPASGNITQGNSLTVSIVENGDNVNVVTANLNYDASKLQCNGVGGGSFAQTISASCGGGAVTVSRYVTPGQPGLNGAQTVATVSFTALASSGTTSITFGASQVASAGVNTLASTAGGSYTLTAPATNPGNPSTPTTPSGSNNVSSPQGSAVTYGPKASPANNATTHSATNSGTATSSAATTAKPSDVLSEQQSDKSDKDADSNKSDNKAQTSGKKDSSNTARNLAILLGLLAVVGGIIASQRYRDAQVEKAAVAAAAVSAKKAATKKAKAAAKTTKKVVKKPATKKKPTARKK